MAPVAALFSLIMYLSYSGRSRSRPSLFPSQPVVLDHGFKSHSEQCCFGAFCQRCSPFRTSFLKSLVTASHRSSLFIMSLRSFALSGYMIMVSNDMESFVDLAWKQNANTAKR